MNLKVVPVDLTTNTSPTYDQTKVSLIGKISQKTIDGKVVVGPPRVKYRNTVSGPEAITPNDIVITDNNRAFICTTETTGLVTLAGYTLDPISGALTYIGSIKFAVLDAPATTHTARGLKVVDDGVSGWKVFWMSTGNQLQNGGLYMVNNLALSDFTFVAPIIPTATAPGQKAVYKLEDSPFTLTNGAGLILNKANSRIYMHRGVAATHSYAVFNYGGTITTVGANGITSDLWLFETGNLPALSGTLLLTNSEELTIPTSGPNAGQACAVFFTNTTMYRGRLSDLTSGATTWPSLEFANANADPSSIVNSTVVRATYSDTLQRAVLFAGSSTAAQYILVKQFISDSSDLYVSTGGNDNFEATLQEMYRFKITALPVGFDSRNGILAMLSTTVGQRGVLTAAFDVDDIYGSTYIVTPVLDVTNQIMTRVTAGSVRQNRASPIRVYYRTSGFNTPTGGWVAIPDSLDMGAVMSSTGQVQFKITYKVFDGNATNALQMYSLGVITMDLNAISDYWEYSHDDSNPGNPSISAFRLKKAYASSVPTLTFRANDLSNNLYVQSTTAADPSRFEYSTDDGLTWSALGIIPNTVGTLIRYTFLTPPGVDVRPSIRES